VNNTGTHQHCVWMSDVTPRTVERDDGILEFLRRWTGGKRLENKQQNNDRSQVTVDAFGDRRRSKSERSSTKTTFTQRVTAGR